MTRVEEPEVVAAAARLAAAAATRTPCASLRDLIGPGDIDIAYQVQLRNINGECASGATIVGRKIGLTSPAVQRQMGVDQPDFGVLLDHMDCTGDPDVTFTRLIQPRMEAEIAMVVSSDIDAVITAQTAPEHVSDVHAALEIVDSRIENWQISLADTIADNASSGLYVLGDSVAVTAAPDLETVRMQMFADGELVSHGTGSDCLGSPWAAFAWLANTSLSYGAPLRAGEIVLSGALGPMVPVSAGSHYTAMFTGIGRVAVIFTQ